MSFSVPPDLEKRCDELITHYPQKRSAVLMFLHEFQERFGHISPEAVNWIAQKLELQPINVYELVTFYPMFHQKAVGKHHLKICRTLSCMLAGSYKVHDRLCSALKLDPHLHGPQTTADGRFTVEFVECLASCGSGPVVMCNEALHERVAPEAASQLLEKCK